LGNVLDVEKIAFADAAQFTRAPIVKSLGQARHLFENLKNLNSEFPAEKLKCTVSYRVAFVSDLRVALVTSSKSAAQNS
jgi:hypothetical protein